MKYISYIKHYTNYISENLRLKMTETDLKNKDIYWIYVFEKSKITWLQVRYEMTAQDFVCFFLFSNLSPCLSSFLAGFTFRVFLIWLLIFLVRSSGKKARMFLSQKPPILLAHSGSWSQSLWPGQWDALIGLRQSEHFLSRG